jgi:hypothetical protein
VGLLDLVGADDPLLEGQLIRIILGSHR